MAIDWQMEADRANRLYADASHRIEALEKHKRLQTEDVMNLGAQLGQAWRRIAQLEAALEEARQLVTEANNSLYGSQGYFHSLNGGPFNKYHLAEGIETLKAQSNRNYHRIEQLEREIGEAVLAEREACAAIAAKRPHHSGLEIAELIHARADAGIGCGKSVIEPWSAVLDQTSPPKGDN